MNGRPFIHQRQIASIMKDGRGADWTEEKAYRPDPFKALGESWNDTRPFGWLSAFAGQLPVLIALAIAAYFAAQLLRGWLA